MQAARMKNNRPPNPRQRTSQGGLRASESRIAVNGVLGVVPLVGDTNVLNFQCSQCSRRCKILSGQDGLRVR